MAAVLLCLCAALFQPSAAQGLATTNNTGTPMEIPPIQYDASSGPCDENCCMQQQEHTRQSILAQHMTTRCFISREFKNNQVWIMDTFFRDHFVVAMMLMTEELVVNAYTQMAALGAMLDAKFQLETQRLFQQKAAIAHKSYHPSHEMCVIGTAARGLASAGRNAEVDALVLSERALDRELGELGSVAATGPFDDARDRMTNVVEAYCNQDDNDQKMQFLCEQRNPPERINKDIDFTNTMGVPLTFDIDLTDDTLTDNETDIFALGANLYNPVVLTRINEGQMKNVQGQEMWANARSLAAKRSVAYNSFDSIVAMKAAGTQASEDTQKFIKIIFEQMDIPDDEIEIILGKRPSYYALMQVLSQTIYQNPQFFTGLYDTPVNVARKDVSMQAINLMVDRDSYRNELRTESLLAGILELFVIQEENALESRVKLIRNLDTQQPESPRPSPRSGAAP